MCGGCGRRHLAERRYLDLIRLVKCILAEPVRDYEIVKAVKKQKKVAGSRPWSCASPPNRPGEHHTRTREADSARPGWGLTRDVTPGGPSCKQLLSSGATKPAHGNGRPVQGSGGERL